MHVRWGTIKSIETSMAKYGNLILSGKSGEKYCFQSWSFDTRFRSVGAVFFVSKRLFNDKNFHRASHHAIYIGQTACMSEPMGTVSQIDAFEKHGANCVCVFPASDEAQRMSIVEDLIAGQQPSLQR
jgi:hypothetical protein